jgi:hypothetical protein
LISKAISVNTQNKSYCKGDLVMEEWKSICGTDGKIEVSDRGRVRSLLRGKPCILKTQKDRRGYNRVRLTIHRVKRTIKVHREVARAFIPNPLNLPQVNHKDGNKNNNAVENLEWVTNQQNAAHAIRTGLWQGVIDAAKRGNASRKTPIVGFCGETVRCFESVSEAERYVGSRHISDVLKGKRSQAKGWTFIRKGGDANASLHD